LESFQAGPPGTLRRLEGRQPVGRQHIVSNLVNFEQNMLAQMRQLRERSRAEIGTAVDESNIQPLEQLIENFRNRLTFWEGRAAELGG
jgi:hypothetical protein